MIYFEYSYDNTMACNFDLSLNNYKKKLIIIIVIVIVITITLIIIIEISPWLMISGEALLNISY